MRVLHLNFHRGWGGQPQRILTLGREMVLRGHEVALGVPGDGILARKAREAGLTVFGDLAFRPPSNLVSFLRDVREVRRIVRRWLPDALHTHGSQDTWVGVVANRWIGGPRLPHLLTRHNTKRIADSAANRYLYGRAIDKLVVASASVLERYRPFIERGLVSRAEVGVIHSSIDFDRFEGPLDAWRIRRELKLSTEDLLVGCVGRLVKDKGQAVLLEAAALLAGRQPRARYVLIGTGTEEESLRRLVERLGLRGSVFFVGFREDVPDITAGLDLSVLPSIDCDASPAVLKEAMALGKPVVATDIGGAREIVADEESGLIVPPGDASALARAIDAILSKPDRGRTMGEKGRRIVTELFRPETLCDRYLEVYRSLLKIR